MMKAPRERDAARAGGAASAPHTQPQVEHMKVVARMPTELSVEERNLLSVAYKNVAARGVSGPSTSTRAGPPG